jgi:hypothetical protein
MPFPQKLRRYHAPPAPFDLPVFYRGLLSLPGSQTPQPEHARAEVRLGCGVVEQDLHLAGQLSRIEGSLHQEKHIYVIGLRLWRREMGAKWDMAICAMPTRRAMFFCHPMVVECTNGRCDCLAFRVFRVFRG